MARTCKRSKDSKLSLSSFKVPFLSQKSLFSVLYMIGIVHHVDAHRAERDSTTVTLLHHSIYNRTYITSNRKRRAKKETVRTTLALARPPSPPDVIQQIAVRQRSCLCRIASLEYHRRSLGPPSITSYLREWNGRCGTRTGHLEMAWDRGECNKGWRYVSVNHYSVCQAFIPQYVLFLILS